MTNDVSEFTILSDEEEEEIPEVGALEGVPEGVPISKALSRREQNTVGHVVQFPPKVGGKLAVRGQKAERVPTPAELRHHAAMAEEKAAFVARDPLVRASERPTDSMEMLALVRTAVAKEASSLQFQRIMLEQVGKDTGQISSRRIDALKKIADIELDLKKMGVEMIDVRSEKFQRIFKLWIETIRVIAEQTMNPEQIDLFFNRLSTAMEGWEERAAEALR